MSKTARRALPIAILLALSAPTLLAARELTFAERVAAQEAIERVYYAHQIGTALPFEEAVPRGVLEQKVRRYLRQSAALEQVWHTPVTGEMLEAEMDRILRSSRMPDRLREVYRALGGNLFVLKECLARPALVDRLSRSFFSADGAIHAPTRAEAEELRVRLIRGELDPLADDVHRIVIDDRPGETTDPGNPVGGGPSPVARRRIRDAASEGLTFAGTTEPQRLSSSTLSIGPLAEDSESFFFVVRLNRADATPGEIRYTFSKLSWDAWWELHGGDLDDTTVRSVARETAATPDLLDHSGHPIPACSPGDTWDNAGLDPIPESRNYHVAVWTGSLMVVWGGVPPRDSSYAAVRTGGRYDPLTDTWMPMTTAGAPPGSYSATAVWTGHEMIVWGGTTRLVSGIRLNSGGRYDPVKDAWNSTTTVGAPTPRVGHTAVWTGTAMIIWGGNHADYDATATGARYDPTTNQWYPIALAGAPSKRIWHEAVWTGKTMVVWGGVEANPPPALSKYPNLGGRYDPACDCWQSTTAVNAPVGRQNLAAVWTGSEMVVWGGISDSGEKASGGRYDPDLDRWSPVSSAGEPAPRHFRARTIWTGTEMLIWGGARLFGELTDAARYLPAEDRWTPINGIGSPSAREGHTAVWTGSLMIVWGGSQLPDGGRYDPAVDSWTPTSRPVLQVNQLFHAAVWTGNEMIVWGGFVSNVGWDLGRGARYDPLLDRWTAMSTANAPLGREKPLAAWTGREMLLWGGSDNYGSSAVNTGGRYDPITDSWSAITTAGAPPPLKDTAGVWTGTELVVWGGTKYGNVTNEGGRYDPVQDRWTRIATAGAPAARWGHTAVWTGQEMLIWGGKAAGELDSGGRYNPSLDRWLPTSTAGAGYPRHAHSALWTGQEMLIWGGIAQTPFGIQQTGIGARYDPGTDSWRIMSGVDIPRGRTSQTAIWTGREMIVWGGVVDGQPADTGGRYDPLRNEWAATSVHHAPERRYGHTAIWTGEMMLIWGGPSGRMVPTGGRYLPDPGGPRLVVDAGEDRFVECSSGAGTPVTLAAGAAACDGSTALSYRWSGPFPEGGGTVSGSTPTITLPLGASTLQLRVEDEAGHVAEDSVVLTTRDTTPPLLICPFVAATECASAVGTAVSIPAAVAADACDGQPAITNSLGSSADASGSYPLGTTEVEMTARDASGNQSRCAFPVAVHDTTPPQIALHLAPQILWPPNHRLVDVHTSVAATDACGSVGLALRAIGSDEADDAEGPGDGETSGDVQGADIGSPDVDFRLRAERDGNRGGRIYTIAYSARDGSGNEARATSFAFVPHDQGGQVEPLLLSVEESAGQTTVRWNPVPGADAYTAVRGRLAELKEATSLIELANVSCLKADIGDPGSLTRRDAEVPPPGEAFYYLVAYHDGGDSGMGSASATKPRVGSTAGCN